MIVGNELKKCVGWGIFFSFVCVSCLNDNTISAKVQFKTDTLSISAYLLQKNIKAQKLPAGVWYVLDSVGLGVLPMLTDSINISYTAQSIPSEMTMDQNAGTTVLLSTIIAGLQYSLPIFPAGSKGRVYIPSGLAFGTNAHNQIPPNSNLAYAVTMNFVKSNRLPTDLAAIAAYLTRIGDSLKAANKIIQTQTGTNLPYYVDTLGTGISPLLKDSILVTYKGRILNADTLLVKVTTPVKLSLKSQMNGWRNIIPLLKEGSYATLLIPSGYGYGSNVLPGIPANSNLMYQIKLVKVIHH
ncbi:MAG: FKBP-type peptidyl-prolyl cis-trans isomerase [Bacteroidetes bacterium]|nr:FKBP-type peptidyl-prolyl cis-trans isomerase [Bacteroidota bacterium]MBS1541595.1 FKBP-type peptidyl-prolyl cis-trans isomerase [Bacteroidota bacterium]